MTPKEKAEELHVEYWHLTNDERLAKQCALITIDEKIKTCNKFYEKLSFPAEVKSDMGYICFKKELDYLNEVKQEIEKL